MPRNRRSSRAYQELVRLLEAAVEIGAECVELEYKDADLEVFYLLGDGGIGGTPVPRDLQQAVVDEICDQAGLARRVKGKMHLEILGEEYNVTAEEYMSFGESAFRLRLKKRR